MRHELGPLGHLGRLPHEREDHERQTGRQCKLRLSEPTREARHVGTYGSAGHDNGDLGARLVLLGVIVVHRLDVRRDSYRRWGVGGRHGYGVDVA